MKTYTIKSQKHYSSSGFGLGFVPYLFKKRMAKSFKFDASCIYDLKSVDQYDINKLFGWSQLYHETNSARLGWTWNLKKKKMEIHAYCHVNKERKTQWLCDVDVDTWYVGEIWLENMCYYFRVLNENKTDILGYTHIEYDFCLNIGYSLKPYFGGNQVAPQQMKIYIQ